MTLGNDDKRTLPVCLKRCSKCRLPRPRSERCFPMQRQARPEWKPSLSSACLLCAPWYSRLMRARRLARNEWKERLKESGYRARRKADPERYAAWLDYNREWLRERHGYTPRKVAHTDLHVPTAPVRMAFAVSDLTLGEVAHRAGYDREGLKRALEREMMPVPTALATLEALGLAPAEVGL